MYELSGPRFFKFAWRMPAYKSVIRARLEQESEDESSNNNGNSYIDLNQIKSNAPGEPNNGITMLNLTTGKMSASETANLIDYSNVS